MTYVLTGIPVEPGAPAPIRPEITAFISDETKKIQVSLFIRALTTFQNMDVTDMKSFFQIAGMLIMTCLDDRNMLTTIFTSQVFTDFLRFRGTESQRKAKRRKPGSVPTTRSRFRLGIGLTWYCSRCA